MYDKFAILNSLNYLLYRFQLLITFLYSFQPFFLFFFSSFFITLSNNVHRGKTHCIDDLLYCAHDDIKNDCVHTMCYTSLLLGWKWFVGYE